MREIYYSVDGEQFEEIKISCQKIENVFWKKKEVFRNKIMKKTNKR